MYVVVCQTDENKEDQTYISRGSLSRVLMDNWDGALIAANSRGGAALIGPGVVGESGRGVEVLAGRVGGVHIAPPGSCAVHCLTVTLHLWGRE